MNGREPMLIESLRLAGFRGFGAPLEIDFGKRLTIIFGGNGTGKSSIVQAIEFGLTGAAHGPEDQVLPTQVLSYDRSERPGSINLRLTTGTRTAELRSSTDEGQAGIRDRFRALTSIEWPERMTLPVSVTHILWQGLLGRVVRPDDASPEIDLTSLCVGSDLRTATVRAERMEDVFRRRATGRNIDEEVRKARERLEMATAVAEAAAPRESYVPSRTVLLASLRDAAGTLGVEPPDDVSDEVVARLLDQGESQLREKQAAYETLEGLLAEVAASAGRARSLAVIGQRLEVQGAEVARLLALVKELGTTRASDQLALAAVQKESAISAATVDTLRASQAWQRRLVELERVRYQAKEKCDEIEGRLEVTRAAADAEQAKLAAITQEHRHALVGTERFTAETVAIGEALGHMEAAPRPEDIEQMSRKLASIHQTRVESEGNARRLYAALEHYEAEGRQAEEHLHTLSDSLSAFVAAATTLKALADDCLCPLCGHRHDDRTALMSAMDAVIEERASGTSDVRRVLDEARRRTEQAREQCAVARAAVERATAEESRVEAEVRQLITSQKLARDRAARQLADCGLQLDPSQLARQTIADRTLELERMRSELTGLETIHKMAEDRWKVADSTLSETQSLADSARSALDAASAALDSHRLAAVASSIPLEEEALLSQHAGIERQMSVAKAKVRESIQACADAESALQKEMADQATLTSERNLIAIQESAFVDACSAVGLGNVPLEEWARRRNETLEARRQAEAGLERLRSCRQHVLDIRAQAEYQNALAAREGCDRELRDLQAQQSRLARIHGRFRELHASLVDAQRSAASTVLAQIRDPARLLFRAMLGGTPFDLDFQYEDTRLVAGLTVPESPGVPEAAHFLSAAQLNVAALSLRLALAARQTWCRLRTVVLDDPILEMDSLTQAGVLDGLESLLVTEQEGWRDLQIIMTTWSEEFAVLAAHRLAHLNSETDTNAPSFRMYKVGLASDGAPELTRFEPRWGTHSTEVVA